MFGKNKKPEKKAIERRKFERIKKSFILSYFDLKRPGHKFEITQLKNISLGGMRFVTTRKFDPSTKLGVELKTPYISGTTYLEGTVLQSHERMKGAIYETRLEFDSLDTEATALLEKLMGFFIDAKDQGHE
ncbi:MAG: PilZ domain-containing protein [Candidatus Omnitrophica bacterium]|nr:PilZ domain-containing protein [Candidatus Omnitrophota bacterium]